MNNVLYNVLLILCCVAICTLFLIALIEFVYVSVTRYKRKIIADNDRKHFEYNDKRMAEESLSKRFDGLYIEIDKLWNTINTLKEDKKNVSQKKNSRR